MDRIIFFELLNKAELEYEIKIRLEEPKDTVILLKKQILQLALRVPSEEIVDSVLDVETDLDELTTTLKYIESKILLLEQGNLRFYKKIKTFINHLFYRLERIDIDLDSSEVNRLSQAKEKFLNLESKFKSLSITSNDINPQPLILNHPSSTPNTPNETIFHTMPPEIQSQSLNSIPNNSLNELKRIKYDGNSCPRSFIQKIQEFSISRNISSNKLLDHAFELLTDNALHWYRFKRDSLLSWDELCEALILDFGGFDFDHKLLQAINGRTQGKDEPIVVFISILSGMFARLSEKLSETMKLQIIIRNIRPCYSPYIANNSINSILDLISCCQKYEEFLDKEKRFSEPQSTNNPSAVEFNYKSSNLTSKPSTSNAFPPRTNFNRFYNKPQVNTISRHNNNAFCVRCRINGHTLTNCPQPRSLIICFGCGLKGVKFYDCPNCNKSNNSKN